MVREKLHNTGVSDVFIKIFVFLSFLISPCFSHSTHIVGGAITYVYNGGSSYTITLKIYRDCAGVAFPDPVTISVAGYNGATFSPTRDITINLGTVTPVPSNLDTCADPPNPMPCVEEGIYSISVDNLPPNPGGYHLYYQVKARNLTLTNIDATNNKVGETFYAYIPGTNISDIIWNETFTLANGTTTDVGATAWSIANGAPAPNYAEVQGNIFEVSGADNAQVTWTSQVINISAFPTAGVNLSVGLSEGNTLEANDSVLVYYSLDGGAWTLFSNNGFFANDFGSGVSSALGLIGNNVQIMIVVHYDGASSGEIYQVDNVLVSGNDFFPNDNAVFTLFPPLFLCVGQTFVFDHSATDADGDSLAYNFYTPYDGWDGNPPISTVPPTYSNNNASFTPVNFLGGFSASNPLGGSPLNLNSSTGLLTGTPNTIGQYVVGVMVKEYRNGICIDSTLRDFQFNVVNCPLPATAVLPDTTFACSGLSVSFSNLGNPSTNNWWNFGDPAVTNDTSVLANPSYNYPVEGYYDVVLITNKGTLCADTDTTVVLVAWVDAGFVADTVGCAGDLFDFNDTSSGSSNLTITGYQWDFGDGTSISTAPDTAHIYITDGSYTVTHIVTTDLGCTDTVTKTVVINPAPVFVVDMTGGPDSVWNSPSVVRDCKVCGATGVSMVCITFILTLDPGTQAISFDLTAGAVPPGALYYQISCGDSFPVGDTICISGVGPHQITFCKPGNNPNVYTISAITAPEVSPPITVSDGCMDTISATGYIESSVTWTSVSPGAQGTYDAYMNCAAGCDTVIVTSQPGYPPSVDYMVCGLPAGGGSCSMTPVCDTTTVFFVSTLATAINPQNPTICFGGSNVTITAVPTGGAAPYSYLWSTGETTAAINVGVGTFFVTVSDTTNCQPVTDSVMVTAFASNITANAGVDQVICAGSPAVNLSGSVTGVTTGTWSGGSGSFNPNNDSLNTTYNPTVGEISAGMVQLYLTTTNNGTCPSDTDTILITFNAVPTTANAGADQVVCGVTSATLSANTPTIGTGVWSIVSGSATITNPNSPSTTVTGLVAGNTFIFRWTISNGVCPLSTDSVTINVDLEPTVANAGPDQFLCATTTTTLAGNTPTVGNGTWSVISGNATVTSQTSPTSPVTGLLLGDTVVLQWTIAQGFCFSSDTVNIFIDDSLYSDTASTPSTTFCGGSQMGTATVIASGGISPYIYQWEVDAGSQTNSTATGLETGTYSVTVTDIYGCQIIDSVFVDYHPPCLLIYEGKDLCFGINDGFTIQVKAVGGSPPYTYLWSNGATSMDISNLAPGTYSVTMTTSEGCKGITSVTIVEPPPITVTMSSTPVKCKGGSDGTVTANPSGGTPSYSYLWNNGQTGSTVVGLSAGTYSVTVMDDNGCTKISSVIVTEPATLLSVNASATDALCKDVCNGTLSATASGGVPGYSFSWSTGNGANQSNICDGSYIVTVTDANNCVKTATASVNEPSFVIASATSMDALCEDSCNGTLSASASGGIAGYSFSWNNGLGAGANKSNVCAGTYSVTAMDANGCTATTSSIINQPAVLIVTAAATDVLCNGDCNGTLSANASGGTSGYTYSWSGGLGNGSNISGVCVDSYTVTATDANGCTAFASALVNQPAILIVSIDSSMNVSCKGGNDGFASDVFSGGTSSYSLQWSNGTFGSFAQNLSAGIYYLSITDANGCVATDSITITEPATSLSANTSSTSALCKGDNNGTATVFPAGATSPYSYQWDGAANNQTDSTATGLIAGTYSVTITDNNNCTFDTLVSVVEPSTLLALDTSSTFVICNGDDNGTATVTPSGGISPYTFIWDVNANSQTDSTATGLSAGTYSVTVTDNNNCAMDTIVFVDQPFSPLSIIFSVDSVNCFEGNDGAATVTPSGGTSPYTYLWDDANSQTDSTATGLVAGTLNVTVTDNTGNCKAGNGIIVNQPDSLFLISSSTNVSCFGGNDGSAQVVASGGTSPYTYLWNSGQSSSQISNLTSQIYSVTVTDNNSCSDSADFFITEPVAPLSISSLVFSNVNCNGGNDGNASISVSGGTIPYTFLWDDTNQTTTSNVIGLMAGLYNVIINDSNNCIIDTSVTISEPSPGLTVSISATDVNCFGGSDGTATITPAGGTSPYFFQWDSLAGFQTDSTATGLMTGTFSVTVTDANGCLLIDSTSVFVGQPASYVSVYISQDNVTCNGDSNAIGTLSVSGGTPPYTFLWDTNANSQTDSTATGLVAGTYNATVTDDNGCADTAIAVIITEPSPLILSPSSTDVICKGENNGAAVIIPSGGTSPYSFQWDSAANLQTDSMATGLIAGTYSAMVIDSNNCTADTFVTVNEPVDSLTLSTSVTDVLCLGDSNGMATITPSGGISPYSYQWDSNAGMQTDSAATGLKPGTYSVIVTDSSGCADSTTSVTISQPQEVVSISSADTMICKGDSAVIKAEGSGGVSPYSYVWSIGTGQSQTVSPSNNTIYTVIVTDNNNCASDTDSVTVFVRQFYPDSLVFSCGTAVSCTLCIGDSTNISATYFGEFPPYNYLWNQNLGSGLVPPNNPVSPLITTEYILKISDQCGMLQDTLTLYVDTFPVIDLLSVIPGCEPLTVGFENSVQNPPGTTYTWDFGDGDMATDTNDAISHTYLNDNTYYVSLIVSTPNCSDTADTAATVLVYPLPEPNCTASPLTATLQNPVINFSTGNFTSWLWDFNDGAIDSSQNPVHTYSDSGDYFVTVLVTNEFNCENTCEVQVRINPLYPIGIPNAFTPNPNGPNGGVYSFDDFSNNVFFPITRYVTDYHMEIFNRWGELLFESFDINQGWDGYYRGELCQMDVYVWKIYIKWWDSMEFNDVGDVTLLR